MSVKQAVGLRRIQIRGLLKQFSKTFAALAVGVLLTLCSIGVVTAHNASEQSSKGTQSCSGACHSHAQGIGVAAFDNKLEEDDKEPIPPAGWLQIPINLSLLYIPVIFFAYWLSTNRLKIHLSTQLRI